MDAADVLKIAIDRKVAFVPAQPFMQQVARETPCGLTSRIHRPIRLEKDHKTA